MNTTREIDTDGLAGRIEAFPGFGQVRDAAGSAGVDAYLVGGAVRDALLGADRADLDVVVDGDHRALLAALGGEARSHYRFGTATVRGEAGAIDVARARAETYARPGALPDVRPAAIDDDLARRDFTINAMAVPVTEPGRLLDPHGGLDDLRAGALRYLHPGSFVDDPARALRAARYASRLELSVEAQTLAALRAADLGTVSAERREAELRRLAADRQPQRGFELLAEWGLFDLADDGGELIDAVARLLAEPPWSGIADAADAILAAAGGGPDGAQELAAVRPGRASEIVAAARGRSGVELALARALGAGWLDTYVADLRRVRLEITGDDLLEAGVPQGPAVGRALDEALRAKLDGEVSGRERELEVALHAARS